MSNLENANAKSAEERKRAEMHRTYGMWYKEGREKRQAAEAEMVRMENDLKAKLLEIQH